MKLSKPIATLLLVASLALVQACGVGEASVADGREISAALPVPVEVSRPERSNIYATYQATATIASDQAARALARVGGQVVEVLVEEGEYVRKGQVLARLDGERLRLQMLSARADLEKARGEYARFEELHARGVVSASMYDGLHYELKALEAVYDLAALNYGYSNIRAPIAGVVTDRHIKKGENLSPSQVAFDVADTSKLVAYLQIPQSDFDKVHVGDRATLSVDAMPDMPFHTTIERISPTIDTRNGTFRATAIIDNTVGLLAPGMFARFTIAYEKHSDALTIPAHALVREDEETIVYVVRDRAVERRPVKTGIEYQDDIEIVDGLADDEEIVVVGQSSLRDGSKVLAESQPADDRFSG